MDYTVVRKRIFGPANVANLAAAQDASPVKVRGAFAVSFLFIATNAGTVTGVKTRSRNTNVPSPVFVDSSSGQAGINMGTETIDGVALNTGGRRVSAYPTFVPFVFNVDEVTINFTGGATGPNALEIFADVYFLEQGGAATPGPADL